MDKEHWLHLKFTRGKESFVAKFIEPVDMVSLRAEMQAEQGTVHRISKTEYDRLVANQEFKQNFSD